MHSQFFYKSHVTEITLVISYQCVFAEHEYDIGIVFLNYNLKEIKFTSWNACH